LEECRDRTHMSYYDSPQQQQRLVLMTLKTLGLYDNDHKKLEQQFCDWDARYQHYNIPKMDHQSAYLLPPPVGYYVYVNEYPSCTNLSQSSWDPLAYSLASCQDISLQHYQFNSRSFPWSNSTTWTWSPSFFNFTLFYTKRHLILIRSPFSFSLSAFFFLFFLFFLFFF
jgi:hypothetical protein